MVVPRKTSAHIGDWLPVGFLARGTVLKVRTHIVPSAEMSGDADEEAAD